MTMFTAEKRHYFCGGYAQGFGNNNNNYGFSSTSSSSGIIGSDILNNIVAPLMAEEELRNLQSLNNQNTESISKVDQEWLQLSIGGHSHQDQNNNNNNGSNTNLVELELMPSGNTHSETTTRPEFRAPRPVTNFATEFSPFFLQQQQQQQYRTWTNYNIFPPQNQEIKWPAFRAIPISITAAASSSSSSPCSVMASGSSYFQVYGGGVDMAAVPVGLDFRVIQPPRRPHSGIWFMLQASQNQEKEAFLPQISKSYLRIKDGRMTIRVVIKYLVNKLRLENESEIEITCKGQRLLPFLTLQHVRDNIWSNPRDFITLLPNASTTPHIMVLHYARTASN